MRPLRVLFVSCGSLALASLSRVSAGEDAPAPVPPREIGGVSETVSGHVVRDPFRGLEDRAAASAWIDAHTAKADAWFAAHPDEALDKRLMELSSLGGVGDPKVVGPRTFFTRNDGKSEQSRLVVLEEGKER